MRLATNPGPSELKRSAFLPFCRPTIGEDEIAAVAECLRSGWITSGPRVVDFEAAFSRRLGGHAVAVNSATAGLHLALAALDLGPRDEVIVPSITWASTANVVELCGARTVFADVESDTLCIDPADVARRMTPRTRAIIPVHFAGLPADLEGLRTLAQARGVALIEDAAHALGASYHGIEIGAGEDPTVFSFHPIKNITTAEGGMILCRNPALAERLRLLRFHGVSKDAWKRHQRGGASTYDVLEPGFKFNLTDMQAALGLKQLAKLDGFNERRRGLAERYDRLLADVPQVVPLVRNRGLTVHASHLYVVRLRLERLSLDRDQFMLALERENIGTGLHFPALHLSRWYRRKYGYRSGSLPRAEQAAERILSLPLYPLLNEEDQDDVVRAVRHVIRKAQS